MSLLFRLVQWVPAVRSLEAERDALRSEQNSIKLKLRAASAEMGVLEEQLRMLKGERDRLAQDVARQRAANDSQSGRLNAAIAASDALTKERDGLAQERRALIAQNQAALAGRERATKPPDGQRKRGGPG